MEKLFGKIGGGIATAETNIEEEKTSKTASRFTTTELLPAKKATAPLNLTAAAGP
jgi:hypothetical protein